VGLRCHAALPLPPRAARGGYARRLLFPCGPHLSPSLPAPNLSLLPCPTRPLPCSLAEPPLPPPILARCEPGLPSLSSSISPPSSFLRARRCPPRAAATPALKLAGPVRPGGAQPDPAPSRARGGAARPPALGTAALGPAMAARRPPGPARPRRPPPSSRPYGPLPRHGGRPWPRLGTPARLPLGTAPACPRPAPARSRPPAPASPLARRFACALALQPRRPYGMAMARSARAPARRGTASPSLVEHLAPLPARAPVVAPYAAPSRRAAPATRPPRHALIVSCRPGAALKLGPTCLWRVTLSSASARPRRVHG
jgi:hypothetical protein